MITPLLRADAPVTDAALNVVALVATEHLHKVAEAGFFAKLGDADFMRVATLLAMKSYEEGGCPIGGVIVDGAGRIVGKGHNTLGQENDSTTHGETAALRDAGRVARLRGEGPVDFRPMTMFTSLTPCRVCCAQIVHRGNFSRVVIGDVSNAPSTAAILIEGGIARVDVVEDAMAVELYRRYAVERPELHYMDWGGWRKWDEVRGGGGV